MDFVSSWGKSGFQALCVSFGIFRHWEIGKFENSVLCIFKELERGADLPGPGLSRVGQSLRVQTIDKWIQVDSSELNLSLNRENRIQFIYIYSSTMFVNCVSTLNFMPSINVRLCGGMWLVYSITFHVFLTWINIFHASTNSFQYPPPLRKLSGAFSRKVAGLSVKSGSKLIRSRKKYTKNNNSKRLVITSELVIAVDRDWLAVSSAINQTSWNESNSW